MAPDLRKHLWALLGSNQRPLPCKHRAGLRRVVRRHAWTGEHRCGCTRFRCLVVAVGSRCSQPVGGTTGGQELAHSCLASCGPEAYFERLLEQAH